MPPVDLAIPLFRYQNHVLTDRHFGFIRRCEATDAAAYEGRRLREALLDKRNAASGVWADTTCRSAANETFLIKTKFVSHIHRKKPKGPPYAETMRWAIPIVVMSNPIRSFCSANTCSTPERFFDFALLPAQTLTFLRKIAIA